MDHPLSPRYVVFMAKRSFLADVTLSRGDKSYLFMLQYVMENRPSKNGTKGTRNTASLDPAH